VIHLLIRCRGADGFIITLPVLPSMEPHIIAMPPGPRAQAVLARGVVPDRLPPHAEAKWLFRELTDCGATGDPAKWSQEKGRVMKERLVDALVEVFGYLDACDWDYRSTRSMGPAGRNGDGTDRFGWSR